MRQKYFTFRRARKAKKTRRKKRRVRIRARLLPFMVERQLMFPFAG